MELVSILGGFVMMAAIFGAGFRAERERAAL